MKYKTTQILNINISALNYAQNLKRALSFLNGAVYNCRMIFTPNPEVIVYANKDASYRRVINSGDLVTADGVGVMLAGMISGSVINGRTTGIDLITGIFKAKRHDNLKCFFLGGKPGVAQKAAYNIMKKYPNVSVIGYADGYFDKKQERAIIKRINRAKPDLLLVGMGFPRQEIWIYENKSRLNVKAAIACGGCLDVFAGLVKRAPLIMRRLGLEWLYRLARQPSRFLRMCQLPVFMIKVLTSLCKRMDS